MKNYKNNNIIYIHRIDCLRNIVSIFVLSNFSIFIQIKLAKTLRSHTDCVYVLQISQNCNLLVSGGFDKSIRLWNFQKSKILRVLYSEEIITNILSTNDMKRIISGNDAGTIQFWNSLNGSVLLSLDCQTSVTALTHIYNSKLIIIG